ncbi:MAG: N-acetyltransferase [Elusimicrobiota bacterium]
MAYDPIIIRSETAADEAVITDIIQSAFGEADQLELLFSVRANISFDPLLSVVAEQGGKIFGHAMYFEVVIEDGAKKHRGVHIAPIAVSPDMQKQGVGERLIRHGLQHCQSMGFELVTVMGPAAYFRRFDFVPAAPHGFTSAIPIPPEDFMVRELAHGALKRMQGKIVYPSFFSDFIERRGRKGYNPGA